MTAEWTLTIVMYLIGGYVCFRLGALVAKRKLNEFFTFMVAEHMDELERMHQELAEAEEDL